MSLAMVGELVRGAAAVRDDREGGAGAARRRRVPLRWRRHQGHGRCPRRRGGSYRTLNRAFGSLLEEAPGRPATAGGAGGKARCSAAFPWPGLRVGRSDAPLAFDAQAFGLPETSLGILPAQIAPARPPHRPDPARRLALTAARFDGPRGTASGPGAFLGGALRRRCPRTAAWRNLLEQLRRCC